MNYAERKVIEFEFVREIYGPCDYDSGLGWLRLQRLPLPRGWNKASTQLLMIIPELYPEIPPSEFYLDRDLRDRHGREPNHYFLSNPHADAGWAWFCLHLEEGWRPSRQIDQGDNLVTVIERILIGLAGEV